MDVDVVEWSPRAGSSATGPGPVLFLVHPQDDAPEIVDALHDWIRLPAADADIEARIETLRRRASGRQDALVFDDGVVRLGGRFVAVSPLESRLLALLAERMGAVVGRDTLLREIWPAAERDRNRLDAAVRRLRRRVSDIGIEIVTVRGRGYAVRLVSS